MALPHQVSARLLAMAALVGAFSLAWRQFSSVSVLVLGQPSTAGQLQRDQEEPFFRNLAANTKLPLDVRYHTADQYGLNDSHQLEAIRDGRLDVVSLRFMQNSQKEQALAGIDLPGMIPDFATARRVAEAFGPSLDRFLQKTYGARLLGIWSFGPQVMFCKQPITSLNGIRGRKVRVASPSLAQVVDSLGGIAVVLPFGDTKEALQLGLVTCAVSSAASAEFDNWGAYTNYYFPLVFQFGFNGYVISNRKWNALSKDQQQRLTAAFKLHTDNLWQYSQNRQGEAENCLTDGPCLRRSPSQLKAVPVSPKEMAQLQQVSHQIALPAWLQLCEKSHPGCRQEWIRSVGPLTPVTKPGGSR